MSFRNNFLMGTKTVTPIGDLQMAAILPKYGKNSENDANSHSDHHFRPFYAPECLGILKQEIFKIQDGCHIAQIW